MGGLILLWSCRPRIAWLEVSLLAITKKIDKRFSESRFKAFLPKRLRDDNCYPDLVPRLGRELLLEIVALVYMGIAIHFADLHGYFNVKASDPAVPSNAKMMYGGAVLSLAITIMCPAFSTLLLVSTMSRDRLALKIKVLGPGDPNKSSEGDADEQIRRNGNFVNAMLAGIYVSNVVVLYMATWIFWAGFIKLSGDLLVLLSSPRLHHESGSPSSAIERV